jgi:hypothetical protein
MSILLFAGQAVASNQGGYEFDNEIEACVAEVGEHANYGDAVRVQHKIVKVKRALLGYALTIDTAVYSESDDAAIRAYATYCVANGNNKPLRFRIRESESGA